MEIKKVKTMKDFIDMEQLELKYYSEEHVTPHEEAYLWHLSNPKMDFALEDNGSIVAFTDILPVRQEIFDRMLSGTYNDKYLSIEDLIDMDSLKEGDSVNLLLSCVVVHEDYRKTDALRSLLNAHLDYYREFISKGIFIDTVITSNVTKAGEHFSERMGFERIGQTEHQTVLYTTSFKQFDLQVRNMRSKLEDLIYRYEKDLMDPVFCLEVDRLENRLSKDFMEYGQSGKIYNREMMMEALKSINDRDVAIRDFTLKCLNLNAAVVHYTATHHSGTDLKTLRTSIWIIEDGKWKILFHQGTEVK